mgnify:CR=1 FL=1
MEKLEQIIETYRLTIQKAELELRNARKRIYYISLLRLVLFVGAIAGTIIFWPDGWLYISIFAILPFILFIWLVKRHNFWFHRKDFLKKKIVINEQELLALIRKFFPLNLNGRAEAHFASALRSPSGSFWKPARS